MRSTAKRQTVHFTIHPKPSVKEEIQRIAQDEGLTPSRVGATALEDWLARRSHIQHRGIFQPMIEQAVANAIDRYAREQLKLGLRNLYSHEQVKALLFNVLRWHLELTSEQADEIKDKAKADAQRNVRELATELAPIITEILQGLSPDARAAI